MCKLGVDPHSCLQYQWQALQKADDPVSFAPKCPVIEAIEKRQQDTAALAAHKECGHGPVPALPLPPPDDSSDLTVEESLGHLPDLCPQVEGDLSVLESIKSGYQKDLLFSKVLNNVGHHKNFKVLSDLLYTHNHADASVLCIPSVIHDKWQITEVVISQAHTVLGHFGLQKTVDYVQCHYWWPYIGQDIEQYCKICPVCQIMKSSTQRVPGLLHSLPVTILGPIFHFLPFSAFPAYSFCALSHLFSTHSLTHHLDHHPVTWQVTWWVTWPFCSQLSHATALQSAVPIVHPLWTASSFPAHNTLSIGCQLMMELYLDCQLTASSWCDLTICDSIVLWPLLFVTSHLYISALLLMVRP